MNNKQNIKEVVHQFILATYLPGEPRDSLRDDTPLQTSGILDSLAVETLVVFIHEQFGIELDVYDISIDRFDRIEDIAAAVVRRQAQRGQGAEGHMS